MLKRIRAYLIKSFDDFRKRPILVTLLLLAVFVAPIMFLERVLSANLQMDIRLLKEHFAATFAQSPVISISLFILILPIAEELMYRGPIRLLDHLLSQTWINIYIQATFLALAIVAQAHIWASDHISPIGFLMIGILLGVVVVKTKSLPIAILIHVIINALAFTGLLISYWFF